MTSQRVRTMTLEDLDQVLTWRNHAEVRRYMYTTQQITRSEHTAWFMRKSTDQAVSLLIYEYDGRPSGFLSFSKIRASRIADWGFYVAPDARRGIGKALGHAALEYAFTELNLHKVCGQVLAFNERSIGFHTALGFKEEGCLRDQHFDGQDFHNVVCFGVLRAEWHATAQGQRQ